MEHLLLEEFSNLDVQMLMFQGNVTFFEEVPKCRNSNFRGGTFSGIVLTHLSSLAFGPLGPGWKISRFLGCLGWRVGVVGEGSDRGYVRPVPSRHIHHLQEWCNTEKISVDFALQALKFETCSVVSAVKKNLPQEKKHSFFWSMLIQPTQTAPLKGAVCFCTWYFGQKLCDTRPTK